MRLMLQLLDILVRGTALMLGLVGAGMAIACVGGAWNDRLDAFTHVAPLWLAMGTASLLMAGLLVRGAERWVVTTLGVVAMAVCSALMAPELIASQKFAPSPTLPGDLKVVQLNAWENNWAPKRTADWVLAQKADVVVIEEGAGKALPFIKILKETFPFSSCEPHRLCEVWIFSRRQIIASGSLPAVTPYPSGSWAKIADAAGTFTVIGVHYAWPVPAGLQQAQSRKLVELMSRFDRRSAIITGDFNSTPWSFGLKRQDKALGMRRWTRALPSWPARQFSRVMSSPTPFLPIDHVYAGKAWQAVEVGRGPTLGSDHRPIIVTFRRQ